MARSPVIPISTATKSATSTSNILEAAANNTIFRDSSFIPIDGPVISTSTSQHKVIDQKNQQQQAQQQPAQQPGQQHEPQERTDSDAEKSGSDSMSFLDKNFAQFVLDMEKEHPGWQDYLRKPINAKHQ
jgi:hypothetical protein